MYNVFSHVERHLLVPILAHDPVALSLEALLDEPEEVLVVHAGGGVDVGVHLAHVVEVTVGHLLLGRQLPSIV